MQSSNLPVGAGGASPATGHEAAELRGPTTDQTLGEHDSAAEHIHLPPPTIWPVAVAGGVSLAFLGLVTSWPVSVLGLLVAIWGVVSWAQELRHELH